jgi:hypothetical protein
VHPGFEAYVDTDPALCTALIVDRHLGHRHPGWAVVGAFGDNLDGAARALAAAVGIDARRLETLRTLGRALNHNAYGDAVTDLRVHPAELLRLMAPFADPLDFVERAPVHDRLVAALHEDLALARACTPRVRVEGAEVFVLEDAPWARRVRGTLGNTRVADAPDRAHAILVPRADGGYTVSVRVPRGARLTADAFCRRYPSGGGREIAAGIDRLPASRLEEVVRDFVDTYRQDGAAQGAVPPASSD